MNHRARHAAQRFELGTTPLIARAVGGVESCYQLPGLDVNLDIGRCPEGAERQSRLLLTHAHIDHAAGLPYYISLRGLYGFPPPVIYAPKESLPFLQKACAAWAQLQSDSLRCAWVGMEPGQTERLGKSWFVQAFEVDHRIDAVGYTLLQERRKLKPELAHLPGAEIGRLAKAGKPIHHVVRHPELSYTGDTTIQVFERSPSIMHSRVLILESTFVGDLVSPTEATKRGHVHLEQVVPYAEAIQSERLLLTHFSNRYDFSQVENHVSSLPQALRERTELVW